MNGWGRYDGSDTAIERREYQWRAADASGKGHLSRNALKHGLSATRLLPEILAVDLVQSHYEALRDEWCPTTPTQEMLVRDIARHQAALERTEQIELAVLRRGALNPLNLGQDLGTGDQLLDAILAAAGTSDAVERISRYRRQHERAFLRSLTALQEAKKIWPATRAKMRVQTPAFSSDGECELYLAERAKNLGFRCPRCDGRRGKWLGSRRVWQCGKCRRQVGTRTGTIMEGSRIGVLSWFRAVELMVKNPSASMADLVAVTKIGRQGTIRKMLGKIRQAMNSPDRSRLLAGLDLVFTDGNGESAEIGVPRKAFLQNEPAEGDQARNEENRSKR